MTLTSKELDKMEETLRRLEEQNRPKARKIVTRDKSGAPVIEYQRSGPSSAFEKASAELAKTSHFVPALPLPRENGTSCTPPDASQSASGGPASAAEASAAAAVAPPADAAMEVRELTALVGISFQEVPSGTERGVGVSPAHENEGLSDDNPLTDLIHRAQAQSLAVARRGRRQSLDERGKGQLLGLLAVGLSLRQAAAVLGVSHTTLRRTLAANAELADEINAARSRAALEPLACVIRESKRSWRAATWLLKYLDEKLKRGDETHDEWDRRMEAEHEAFKKANRIR
jgi:hypothetical protein